MNICPITYKSCVGKYSSEGLKRLSPRLTELSNLPYTAEEQIHEAAARAPKMSIGGIQPKLSARLDVAGGRFVFVDINGRYILKPQNPSYGKLPENEDLSMRLAKATGVDVPLHGLVYSVDGTLTYFIKRFDRVGRNNKLAIEDFAQLLGLSRDTKYDASMEKVAAVIERHCTFPAIEKIKLFRLTLVNFLLGNEDMHLKNFSLITREDIIALTPAYDILNTSIALAQPQEEIALPVMGKKRKLNYSTLVDYFGRQRMGLNDKVVRKVLSEVASALPEWMPLIDRSFLNQELKISYKALIQDRSNRLSMA